jgi:hypothetical protein
MVWQLPILLGYCTIELERRVTGNNYNPHTCKWKVVGNVLINEKNFLRFRRDRWLRRDIPTAQSYCAHRIERQNGIMIDIIMAREVLNLPRNPGRCCDVADHKNHDIREDTEENLRVATPAQSQMNTREYGSQQRFKGVFENRDGHKYKARICVDGLRICLPSVLTDVEAALMYKHAAIILFDNFSCYTEILLSEMPSRKRRWELMGLVVEKLVLKGYV